MKKILSLAVVLIMLMGVFAGCGGDDTAQQSGGGTDAGTTPADGGNSESGGGDAGESSGDTIKFAVVGPMTGDTQEFGLNARKGAELAAKEINEQGGLLGGRMVEIVWYDDRNTTDEAAALAELIAADQSIVAVASGHLSSTVALAACPAYQREGIVSLSASSSHPDYAKIGEYVLRNNITDLPEVQNNVQIIYNSGYRKIGIAAPRTDFGVSFAETFEEMVDVIHELDPEFEVVISSFFLEGTLDYSANITELVNAGVDCIINPAEYMDFAQFAVQVRRTGSEIPLIGAGTVYDPGLMELGGESVEGVRFPSLFNANSADPRIQEFTANYTAEYDTMPNHISVLVYDSTWAIINAIEQTGSDDRTDIMNALHTLEYEGVTGTIYFNENNECPKSQIVFEVQNGEFVEVPNLIGFWDDFLASF